MVQDTTGTISEHQALSEIDRIRNFDSKGAKDPEICKALPGWKRLQMEMKKLSGSNDLHVYPNPVTNESPVPVCINQPSIVTVNLYDYGGTRSGDSFLRALLS